MSMATAVKDVSFASRETKAASAVEALSAFDGIPIDRVTIPQRQLDLANRSRTSLFPWRGQFSPELIELLLAAYADSGDMVLDPFVGSGTTLFEAAHRDLCAVGSEINPAAFVMASTARFINLDAEARTQRLRCFAALIERWWPFPLFQDVDACAVEEYLGSGDRLRHLLAEADTDWFLSNLASNLVIRLSDQLKDGAAIHPTHLWSHVNVLSQTVRDLPQSNAECKVFHADARRLPLPDKSVDLVVTSPPYINVFNYHQNYRPAAEFMGWDILRVARSEFGSNRKNRGNRFLTVVQYAVDMLSTLVELRRLLKPDGRLIIIVGRASNVRGVSFENGRIVAALATGGTGYRLEQRQERKFKTKFGQIIYEDILHFILNERDIEGHDDFGRVLGKAVLASAITRADKDVRPDIEAVLDSAKAVRESPVFEMLSANRQGV